MFILAPPRVLMLLMVSCDLALCTLYMMCFFVTIFLFLMQFSVYYYHHLQENELDTTT